MARHNEKTRWLLRRHLRAVIVAVIGIGLTGFSYLYITDTQKERRQAAFTAEAETFRGQISSAFQQHLNRLSALEAYFTTRAAVSRNQFSTFALKLLQNYEGTLALEWVPRVPADRREALEQTARFHGFSGFEFKQWDGAGKLVRAGERAEYFPVYFVEPYAENQKAVGFDLASDNERKAALDSARDSGKTVISQRITPILEAESQFGILAVLPIYRRDVRADSVERRRQGLLGFVLGVFRVADLIDSATSRPPDSAQLRLEVNDAYAAPAQRRLYSSATGIPERNSDMAITLPIVLPDIDAAWTMTISPLSGHPIFATSSLAMFDLIAGLLLTALLCMVIVSQTNRQHITRRVVAERTRELRASEARFRNFADISADWFWETDEALRIIFLSDRFEQVTGVAPETMIGKSFQEIEPPGTDAEIWRTHLDTLAAHQPFKEFIYPRDEDETGFLSISGRPVFDQVGVFSGYRGVGRDVTERERLERIKDELISTLSHELRTPLTSLKASLGMLKNGVLGVLPKRAREMVDLAYTNGERLNTLVNNILDIEMLTKNRTELRTATFDLSALVGEQVAANHDIADQNNVSFEFLEPGFGLFVEADATKITQVIDNLLSNAAKFSPDGETIRITVAGDRGIVRVAVTDHGPGIPDAFRERIFDRFAQADSSDTRRPGGTGLGLHISRTIVEKHGGKLDFISGIGDGSTFFFELREVAADTEAPVN